MRRVLIDTVAFLALWNTRDQWHDQAVHAYAKLEEEGCDFYTTSYILLECGNAAARHPFRADVFEIREQFRLAGRLLEPKEAELDNAWRRYAQWSDGDVGIVDYVSFEILKRAGIGDVLTRDHHFRAAGFNALI